jgi:hypothetical protein
MSADQQPDGARTAGQIGAIGAAATGVGAVGITIVTAACCVSPVLAPIIVGVLGASGAVWAAGLKPYTWVILAVSAACLAFGFWTVYRPRPACSVKPPRMNAVLDRVSRVCLWFGAVAWAAAVLLRLLTPQ